MPETFYLKRHDTDPPLTTFLTKKNPAGADIPVDLTNATSIRFIMKSAYTPQFLAANGQCTVVGPAPSGQVQYQWIPTDTAASGNFQAEIEVTFSDGTILTCPNTEYMLIQIIDDLG